MVLDAEVAADSTATVRLAGPDARGHNAAMSGATTSGLAARLEAFFRSRPEVLEACLFGSRARGDQRPGSDTDVAVFLDRKACPEPPYGYAADLFAALTTALGGAAVDIVVLNEAPPLLYHRVLRDGIRMFSRDLAATTAREALALSRYCDFAVPLARIEAIHAARAASEDFGR